MKRLAFYCTFFLSVSAFPAYASDDIDSLCEVSRKDWIILSNGGVDAMRNFQGLLDASVCPRLYEQVSKKIEFVTRRDAEMQAVIDELRKQAKNSEEARARVKSMEQELQRERERRSVAEVELENERAARKKLQDRYQPEPSSRDYLSCDVENDIASIDQGNIAGIKFENINVPPRAQYIYDLSRLSEGHASVYQVESNSEQWIRLKISAQRNNSGILFGSLLENDGSTVNFLSRFEFNQEKMSLQGVVFAELNVDRSVGIDVRGNAANINFGNAFRRPPRLWVESIGSCSYLSMLPNVRIGERPSIRVKSRIIPNIPKIP